MYYKEGVTTYLQASPDQSNRPMTKQDKITAINASHEAVMQVADTLRQKALKFENAANTSALYVLVKFDHADTIIGCLQTTDQFFPSMDKAITGNRTKIESITVNPQPGYYYRIVHASEFCDRLADQLTTDAESSKAFYLETIG